MREVGGVGEGLDEGELELEAGGCGGEGGGWGGRRGGGHWWRGGMVVVVVGSITWIGRRVVGVGRAIIARARLFGIDVLGKRDRDDLW